MFELRSHRPDALLEPRDHETHESDAIQLLIGKGLDRPQHAVGGREPPRPAGFVGGGKGRTGGGDNPFWGYQGVRSGRPQITACGDCAPCVLCCGCKACRGNRKPHTQGVNCVSRERLGWVVHERYLSPSYNKPPRQTPSKLLYSVKIDTNFIIQYNISIIVMASSIRTHTPEDRQVTRIVNSLAELKQYSKGPKLCYEPEKDLNPRSVAEEEYFPVDEFEDTDWYEHFQGIRTWVEKTGLEVVKVVPELIPDSLPEEGYVKIHASLGVGSPIYLNLYYRTHGALDIGIVVNPVEYSKPVHDGSVADLDVEEIHEKVDEYRPFVPRRVREFIHECSVLPREARTIALREVGQSYEEVAGVLSYDTETVKDIEQKFLEREQKCEHLFIARTPVPRRVLANRTFERTSSLKESWYICEEICPLEKETEHPITVTLVHGDITSGSDSQNVSTRQFPSLEVCISEIDAGCVFSDSDITSEPKTLVKALPQWRLDETE